MHATSMSTEDTLAEIRRRVEEALPGAQVDAQGGGGHFTIAVVAEQFGGMNRLARQRTVLRAIKDLMAGDRAPVHAVDTLKTRTPAEPG